MRRSVLVFLRHNLLAGTMPRGKNFALQRSVKICFSTAGNGFVPASLFSGKKNAGGRLFIFCHHGQINSPRGSGFPSWLGWAIVEPSMLKVKDTLRATVHLGFDGRVFKAYHGPDAKARFENEARVLRHLETRGCPFVPRLLEADPAQLKIVT